MTDERGERAIEAIVEELRSAAYEEYSRATTPNCESAFRAILRKHLSVSRQDEEAVAWITNLTTPEGVALGPGWSWERPVDSEGQEYSEMRRMGWTVEHIPLGVLRSDGPGET